MGQVLHGSATSTHAGRSMLHAPAARCRDEQTITGRDNRMSRTAHAAMCRLARGEVNQRENEKRVRAHRRPAGDDARQPCHHVADADDVNTHRPRRARDTITAVSSCSSVRT